MTVLEREVATSDLVAPSLPRSPGLHVSTLIKRLLMVTDPQRFSGSVLDPVRMETGFAVERAIEDSWRVRHEDTFRPCEIWKDGVAGSPDAVGLDSRGLHVREIKCTWMSSRDCPEGSKCWHWLVQIKAYCHLVGVNVASLYVLFVNGDYKHGFAPEYRVWDLAFTDLELYENWAMLLRARTAEEITDAAAAPYAEPEQDPEPDAA